jgi:4-amino-4-deoxy-L-arabinose transferase-like glycosyltransferase
VRTSHLREFAIALGAITVGAFVVRVLVIVLVDPTVPALGDASAYHLLANHLADGHGYIRPFDFQRFGRSVATAEYPPLHPFVVSLFARLGARSVEAQRIGLALFGSGTVALIGLLGRRVGGGRAGLLAAVLAAISPMLFLAEATLMSETLFAFLVTAALVLAYRAADAPSLLRFAALGAVLGLAVLTRAEAGVLALLLLVPLAARARGLAAPRRVALGAVGIALVAVVVLPWTIRNQDTFGQLVPVSNNLGTALAGANCRLTYGGESLGSWRSTFRAGDAGRGECFTGFNGRAPGFDEAEAAAAARRQGVDYARDHLGSTPKVALARVLRTFAVFRPAQQTRLEALEGRPLGWERAGTLMFWVLVPCSVAGFVVLRRRRAATWILLAPIVTVVVGSVLTYGNQRFRIGAEPAVLTTAAVGILAAARAVRRRRSGPRRGRAATNAPTHPGTRAARR